MNLSQLNHLNCLFKPEEVTHAPTQSTWFKRMTLSLLLCGFGLFAAPSALAQTWEELSEESQQTLRPLQSGWEEMADNQKRSWLRRVPELKAMPSEEFISAQDRMAEWAALSAQQRELVQERLRNSKQADPVSRARVWNSFINQ